MSYVKQFGAVGDGKTDDTDAIQHAVDSGNGVVRFGKGVYRITRSIEIDLTKHGTLGVTGEQGTATLLMDGPGAALRVVGDHQGTAQPPSVKPHTWQRERMPIISDLEILGRHPHADGIELLRTMQTTVQNVLIRQCRHGIHLIQRNRNFLLANSHIFDCHDTGVFFDRCNLHQVIISGNHISYCKRAGIRQLDGDVHNIQITGNDIEYNSGHSAKAGSDQDRSETTGEIVLDARQGVASEYTIASNTIQATRPALGANVLVMGPDKTPTSVRLIALSGNVIGSRTRNVVMRNATRSSITGNTIYDGTELNVELLNCNNIVLGSNSMATRPAGWNSTSTDGLWIEKCTNCNLIGNTFSDCRLGDESYGGCITIRQSQEIGVSSCQIVDPHVRGIDVIDSQRCRISDNTISRRGDGPPMRCAIRVAGRSRENVVQNNAVSQGSAAAIDCQPSCGHVQGNTVWK